MAKTIRENPEKELAHLLKYCCKENSSEGKGCLDCERHWRIIKEIVSQLGGFAVLEAKLTASKDITKTRGII